tara:strand:- start:48 stop:863 length:816 start_codon:yes stop_codon:yes gene_type:complete
MYLKKTQEIEKEMKLKVQYIEQKNMLRDELDDIIEEHDELLNEYSDLNEQLNDKDSIIQKQISEIRNLIRTKSDLKEARKKIEILKNISKKYLSNIDSLLVRNEKLINEKDSVINVNKNINWKNYKLNQENQQLSEAVSKGSVLKIENITVETIKIKKTGKEVKTKYARKTQKIRVCFTVGSNPISKSEIKKIYLQIRNPNQEILVGQNKIQTSIQSDSIICTSESEIDYKNVEIAHCIDWERKDVLLEGEYSVGLVCEGNRSYEYKFKLK